MKTENLPVRMVRNHLRNIPYFKLPSPYTIRPYLPGDAAAWIRIQAAADRYNPINPGLFEQQFGTDSTVLTERQFYLCDPAGLPIGTASAWFGLDDRRGWGRVHWVAIVPERQGQGLAKPLMTVVCNRLRELGHQRAYLTTATVRIPAIRLYLKFGFRPDVQNEQDRQAWRGLQEKIS